MSTKIVSLMLILAAILTHQGLSNGMFYNTAERCCSVDQWEADLKATGANYKGGVDKMKLKVTMAYDYTNKRWALDQISPSNASANDRLVFLHKQKEKFYIRGDKCYKGELKAEMQQYCVPSNASYHGYHEYGTGEEKLGFDTWSYEFVVFPLRALFEVSREECMPLREGSYGLVANTWAWNTGDESCIPWEEPEMVRSGECYMSFTQHQVRRRGAQNTGQNANAIVTNVAKQVKTPELFEVPENCKEEWVQDIEFNTLQRYFMLRFKKDTKFEEMYTSGALKM